MKRISLYIIFFFCFVTLGAQIPSYTHFETSNGLPSNEIYDIKQDKLGFLWIGTDAGLVKYNCINYRTTHIQIYPSNTFQLNSSNNNFNCNDSSILSISGNNTQHISSINWVRNGSSVSSTTANMLSVTAGGNGMGSGANQFNSSLGLAFDAQGYMYVADYNNSRIQKFPPNSNTSTNGVTIAGGNGSGAALNQLTRPAGIFVSGNFLYVCDYDNFRVMKYPTNPSTSGGAGVIAAKLNLDLVNEVFVTSTGVLYVSEHRMSRVTKFPANSNEFTQGVIVAGGNGQGNALNQLDNPVGIYVKNNNDLYIADRHNHRIVKWISGATAGVIVAGGNGQGNALNQFNHPVDVDFDAAGNMYISEEQGARVMYFLPNSTTASFGAIYLGNNILNFVGHIAFDVNGNLNISDGGNYRVVRLDKKLNTTAYQTGTYTAQITMDNGCTATVGSIQINGGNTNNTSDTTTIQGCDTFLYNGITYANDTAFIDTTFGNCSTHIHTTNIVVTPYEMNIENLNFKGCGSVTYEGVVYTSSIILYDTIVKSASCSKTITITEIVVIPWQYNTNNITLTACASLTYNGILYTSSTVLRDTISVNQNPCLKDINKVDIVITPMTNIYDTTIILGCGSIVFGGNTYTSNDTIIKVVKEIRSCIQHTRVTILNITPITVAYDTTRLTGCSGVLYNGIVYTSNKVFTEIDSTTTPCTHNISVVIINVLTLNIVRDTVTYVGCGSVTFNGNVYTTSTILSQTNTQTESCTQFIHTTIITINNYTIVQDTTTIRGCGSVTHNGIVYTQSDTLNISFIRQDSCTKRNSTTFIIVNPITITNDTIRVSGCDSLVFEGVNYMITDTLRSSITNNNFCSQANRIVHLPLIITYRLWTMDNGL